MSIPIPKYNYRILVPRDTPFRQGIEDIITLLPQLESMTPLERQVVAILTSRKPAEHGSIDIVNGIHVGSYGDYPHFNIRNIYTGTIHVYVAFDKNHVPYYLTMT